MDALLEMIDGTALGADYPVRYRTTVLKAHTRIYEALQNRDPEASMAAMQHHIDDYVHYATKNYPDRLAQRVSWGLLS